MKPARRAGIQGCPDGWCVSLHGWRVLDRVPAKFPHISFVPEMGIILIITRYNSLIITVLSFGMFWVHLYWSETQMTRFAESRSGHLTRIRRFYP
jgi:hypothetical protein